MNPQVENEALLEGSFDADLEVEIALPDRRASFGMRRPRGQLIVRRGEGGEERFDIPSAVARAYKRKLDSGEFLPASRAEALWQLKDISRSCAIRRMEDLLNRRDYAVGEMRRKLLDDGYRSALVDELIERAQAGRALDDARFADTFIRSKLAAGWGRTRIARELARRDIEVEDVPGWPDEYVELGKESDRAYELASRRRLTGKNDYAKLMRFLLSRGFTTAEASAATRRVLEEAEEEM